MRSMIIRLEDYLERKGLELNVEKTKIMRFRKGRGRIEKRDWRRKGKKEWRKNIFFRIYAAEKRKTRSAC